MRTQFLLLLVLSIFMVACTSSTPDSYGSYSSNSGGIVTPTPTPTPGPGNQTYVSHCNGFSTSSNLSGKMKSYFDVFGMYDSRWVRVRFTGVPTNFGSTDSLYIQFYRWRVSPAGTVEQDTTPLRFRLENGQTLQPASQWFGPNGSGTNIGFNRQALYQVASNQDINSLLNYNFLVEGTSVSLGYQVIQVVLTNSSGNVSSTIAYNDVLIPGTNLDSNPNTYASSHPSILHALHPNWSRRLDGWSNQNFYSFMQTYCF